MHDNNFVRRLRTALASWRCRQITLESGTGFADPADLTSQTAGDGGNSIILAAHQLLRLTY